MARPILLMALGQHAEWLRVTKQTRKRAKSKAPPSKTEGRAPKLNLEFIARATGELSI